jgi:hypothetical protein
MGEASSATSGGQTKMGSPPAQAPSSRKQQSGGPSKMGPGGMGTVTDDSGFGIGPLGVLATILTAGFALPLTAGVAVGVGARVADKALNNPDVISFGGTGRTAAKQQTLSRAPTGPDQDRFGHLPGRALAPATASTNQLGAANIITDSNGSEPAKIIKKRKLGT